MNIILIIFFLLLSNSNITLVNYIPTKKFYTITKTLLRIFLFKIINKKEFTKLTLDKNLMALISHINFFSL